MRTSLRLIAGLAVVAFSIGSANAGPAKPANAAPDNSKCSVTSWPMHSTQCHARVNYTSYADCQNKMRENGARGSDSWWWCSNLGLK